MGEEKLTPDNFAVVFGTLRGSTYRAQEDEVIRLFQDSGNLSEVSEIFKFYLEGEYSIDGPRVRNVLALKVAEDTVGVLADNQGDWSAAAHSVSIVCGIKTQTPDPEIRWDHTSYPAGVTFSGLTQRISQKLLILYTLPAPKTAQMRLLADQVMRDYLIEMVTLEQAHRTSWLRKSLGQEMYEYLEPVYAPFGGIQAVAQTLTQEELQQLNMELVLKQMGCSFHEMQRSGFPHSIFPQVMARYTDYLEGYLKLHAGA